MNDDATINENGGAYCGMDRYAARKAIVEELSRQGLLVKIEEYLGQAVGTWAATTVSPHWSLLLGYPDDFFRLGTHG